MVVDGIQIIDLQLELGKVAPPEWLDWDFRKGPALRKHLKIFNSLQLALALHGEQVKP